MKWRLIFGLAVGLATAASRAEELPVLSILEGNILCVHGSRVTGALAEPLRALQPTNHFTGAVLDLRFTAGNEAATSAVTDFLSGWKSPVMVLVNAETRGPAAGLAARLQATGAGLVIGGTNAAGEFHPDIAVTANAADEKLFQANPYAVTTTNGPAPAVANALLPFIDHMSEADLVRRKIKDGDSDDAGPAVRAEPARPVIHDPALARAVDVLKALAILRPARG